MNVLLYPKTRATRELSKAVPLDPMKSGGDGFKTVPDGIEEFYFKTEIDHDYLMRMGRRAAANKSGKCKVGALKVTIIERKKL